jgi:hypothetical protein
MCNRKNRVKYVVLLLVGMVVNNLCAQQLSFQTFATSGTSFQSSVHQIDFTVGEPLTSTYTTGSQVVTQGFQQPMRTRATISIGEPVYLEIPNNVSSQVLVYPNPFQSEITIETGTDESMLLYLYEMSGKLVYQELLTMEISQLNFSHLPVGNYRLSLWNTHGKIYEFALVKVY